jgi:hypothetical protein
VDDIGTEFPSLEAAFLDTCDAVLDIAFEKLRTQQDRRTIPLTSRMSQGARSCTCHSRSPPTAPGKIPMVYRKRQAIAACHREIVRSQTLKAELRVEFEKTQSALEVTRTNLARMRNLAPPQSPQ